MRLRLRYLCVFIYLQRRRLVFADLLQLRQSALDLWPNCGAQDSISLPPLSSLPSFVSFSHTHKLTHNLSLPLSFFPSHLPSLSLLICSVVAFAHSGLRAKPLTLCKMLHKKQTVPANHFILANVFTTSSSDTGTFRILGSIYLPHDPLQASWGILLPQSLKQYAQYVNRSLNPANPSIRQTKHLDLNGLQGRSWNEHKLC